VQLDLLVQLVQAILFVGRLLKDSVLLSMFATSARSLRLSRLQLCRPSVTGMIHVSRRDGETMKGANAMVFSVYCLARYTVLLQRRTIDLRRSSPREGNEATSLADFLDNLVADMGPRGNDSPEFCGGAEVIGPAILDSDTCEDFGPKTRPEKVRNSRDRDKSEKRKDFCRAPIDWLLSDAIASKLRANRRSTPNRPSLCAVK